MERWDWAKLKPLQVGRYGEYLAKMEFTLIGLDVYGSEVDDKGIDFLLRAEPDRYWDVQVKTIRNMSYVFFQKSKFRIRPNLLAAVVHLVQGKPPACYLIPATAWLEPDGVLVDRDYQEGKSEPEYGINISKKNLPALERFRFERTARDLKLAPSTGSWACPTSSKRVANAPQSNFANQ